MSNFETPARAAWTRRRFATACAGTALLLTGCQLPGAGAPPRRVRLRPATEFPPNLPSVAWTLLVREPSATQSLNTARIAVLNPNREVQFIANGQWASRAPEMVMELLVESFENSNRIARVGDRRSRIRPDFELESRLEGFFIEKSDDDKDIATVRLQASLLRKPQRTAITSGPIEVSTEIASSGRGGELALDNIVAAFDESLQEVIVQLVEWTLQTGVGA